LLKDGWMDGYTAFRGMTLTGGLLSRVAKSCSAATLCTTSELAWQRMAHYRGDFELINLLAPEFYI
jgi:hypothetical protein